MQQSTSKLNSHGVKMKRRHTITSGCTLSPRHCCSDESSQLGKWHFVPYSLSHVPRKQAHRCQGSILLWHVGGRRGWRCLSAQPGLLGVSAFEGLSTWTCVAGTTENIFLRHRALLSLDAATQLGQRPKSTDCSSHSSTSFSERSPITLAARCPVTAAALGLIHPLPGSLNSDCLH